MFKIIKLSYKFYIIQNLLCILPLIILLIPDYIIEPISYAYIFNIVNISILIYIISFMFISFKILTNRAQGFTIFAIYIVLCWLLIAGFYTGLIFMKVAANDISSFNTMRENINSGYSTSEKEMSNFYKFLIYDIKSLFPTARNNGLFLSYLIYHFFCQTILFFQFKGNFYETSRY